MKLFRRLFWVVAMASVLASGAKAETMAVMGGSVSVLPDSHVCKDFWTADLGLEITDYGISGAGLCRYTQLGAGVQEEADRLTQVPQYDVYLIWASSNDFKTQEPIGTVNDYTSSDGFDEQQRSTMCGGLNYVLRTIRQHAPKARVVLFTSLPVFNSGSSGYATDAVADKSMRQYVDAEIAWCESQGIAYIDLFRESGITIDNWTTYMHGDGVHPNETGYGLIAPQTSAFLREQIALLHDSLADTLDVQCCINELMQSNVDCLLVDNDFPDSWIELYNGGSNHLSLDGWSIGPAEQPTEAYRLGPEAQIPPGGHLVVYCDKQGEGLHTTFRLESGKGELYLYDSRQTLVDHVSYGKMLAPNTARGRRQDGADDWIEEVYPTPGLPNEGRSGTGLVPDPIFSHESALLTDPIVLTVSLPDDCPEVAQLYWTTDGSEPSLDSPHGKSLQMNVDQSVVVRAKVSVPGMIERRSLTHSYIFHPRETGIPVISLATSDDFLFDETLGILAGDPNDPASNCYQNWRRPVNVEYLAWPDAESDASINQLAECAVGGITSRFWPQKSLKVYAHKRFGQKRLHGHLWHDKPTVENVKSLMLRNGGTRNDGGMLHDALAQRIFGLYTEHLDWQAYEPVICYINGTYRGVYELRERSDEDYVEANYGIEDIEQNNSYYRGNESWNALRELAEAGASYERLGELLDVENFADYLAAEVFAANTDWPGNNVMVWKPATPDGRWRNILKDLDQFSYYPTDKNFLCYVFLDGSEAEQEMSSGRFLHHSVLCALNGHESFRLMFIRRLAVYLGDFLRPSVTLPMFEGMASQIRPELGPTKEAWGQGPTLSWVDHEQDSIRSYLQVRPRDVYQELNAFYGLGGVVSFTVDPSDAPLSICGVALKTDRFEGAWFLDLPIEVEADFGLWQAKVTYTDGSTIISSQRGSHYAFTPSQWGRDVASITLTIDHTANIETVHADEPSSLSCEYDLYGRLVRGGTSTSGIGTFSLQTSVGKRLIIK